MADSNTSQASKIPESKPTSEVQSMNNNGLKKEEEKEKKDTTPSALPKEVLNVPILEKEPESDVQQGETNQEEQGRSTDATSGGGGLKVLSNIRRRMSPSSSEKEEKVDGSVTAAAKRDKSTEATGHELKDKGIARAKLIGRKLFRGASESDKEETTITSTAGDKDEEGNNAGNTEAAAKETGKDEEDKPKEAGILGNVTKIFQKNPAVASVSEEQAEASTASPEYSSAKKEEDYSNPKTATQVEQKEAEVGDKLDKLSKGEEAKIDADAVKKDDSVTGNIEEKKGAQKKGEQSSKSVGVLHSIKTKTNNFVVSLEEMVHKEKERKVAEDKGEKKVEASPSTEQEPEKKESDVGNKVVQILDGIKAKFNDSKKKELTCSTDPSAAAKDTAAHNADESIQELEPVPVEAAKEDQNTPTTPNWRKRVSLLVKPLGGGSMSPSDKSPNTPSKKEGEEETPHSASKEDIKKESNKTGADEDKNRKEEGKRDAQNEPENQSRTTSA